MPTPPFPVKKRMRVAFARRPVILSVVIVDVLTALRVNHWECRADLRLARWLRLDPNQPRQFVPSRVAAFADDRTIKQDQGQTLVPVLLESRLHDFAGCESLRLLCQVIPFDRDSLIGEPMEIGRKAGQGRIDTRTADPC